MQRWKKNLQKCDFDLLQKFEDVTRFSTQEGFNNNLGKPYLEGLRKQDLGETPVGF